MQPHAIVLRWFIEPGVERFQELGGTARGHGDRRDRLRRRSLDGGGQLVQPSACAVRIGAEPRVVARNPPGQRQGAIANLTELIVEIGI